MIAGLLLALAGSFAASMRFSLNAEKRPAATSKENLDHSNPKPNQPARTESQPAGPSIGPIDPHVIAGGGGTSSGGTLTQTATIGEVSASTAQTGGTFTLKGGFWNQLDAATATPTPTPTPTATPTPTPTPTVTPTPTPTPTPSPTNQLQLLLDSSGPDPQQAAALDSVSFFRDPFKVVNDANFFTQPNDRNTRIILFAINLSLNQSEPPSTVRVQLLDANNVSYDVAAEDVRQVPNFSFTQIVFRLPDNLAAGRCTLAIQAHNQLSNSVTIRIRQ
jgi:hypothetical protein